MIKKFKDFKSINERKSGEEIDRIINSEWESMRDKIISHIMDEHGFNKQVASGIVDYENTDVNPDDDGIYANTGYRQVIDLMHEDLSKGREFDIPSMASHIMKNDEGDYQLSLQKED